MTLEEYTRLTEKYDNENSYYDGINPILESLTLEEIEELEKECLTQINNNWSIDMKSNYQLYIWRLFFYCKSMGGLNDWQGQNRMERI